MMMFLFVLCLLLGIAALVTAIALVCSEMYGTGAMLGLVTVMCIIACVVIGNNTQQEDLRNNNTQVKAGIITKIGNGSIEFNHDDQQQLIIDVAGQVYQHYPVNLGQYQIGDVVQYKELDGDFSAYLIGLEKYKK